ncbi:MAG: 50S ribosomal protein L20 [Hirschia sp.]|nr:50S ribosomal protein L20 [Hirschia sp.]MBF18541.1 50S ribosomal protein L20 [Hirschia sp.]MBF20307.1 50S ribosomal protein L20 [Hirschia sp.]|tara:strand:+ start:3649 stop:4011 length:363 start_codon:yes stop_codon:yes gene_type:complete
MPRARGKVPAHARHKKIIKAAKGYYGRRKNTFRTANSAVQKAGQYAYVGRKIKKREYRSLWIQRLNAAVREIDPNLNYSQFINGVTKAGIEVDRKVLSDLAIHEPAAFKAIVDQAKAALA